MRWVFEEIKCWKKDFVEWFDKQTISGKCKA